MKKAAPPGRPAWVSAGRVLGIALVAFTLLIGAAIPAAAAELMRVTFVRHAQSAGNASGNIDTSTPGPSITALGQEQAKAVVGTLGANNYDAIYASTMIRTQQTAGPMSELLHLPIQVLPGLQEIEAGVFEGTPESQAQNGYGRFPLAWALAGQRDLRIPGSIDGNEFDARVDGALQTIYDNGDRNPVVFSHGGAIMFWTMMNVSNLTMEQKLDLLRTAPLSNTNYVVIEGNPADGWRLVNWNGREFGDQPTFESNVQLQLRTLQRQLAAQAKNVLDAFATLNPAKVLAAITQGTVEAVYSVVKFAGAVHEQVAKELTRQAEAGTTVQTAAALSSASAPALSAKAAVAEAPAAVAESSSQKQAATEVSAAKTGDVPKAAAATATEATKEEAATETATATEPSTPAGTSTATGTTANGGTDLKDGNKATPGTTGTSQESAGGGNKVAATVGATTESDAGSAAGSSDSGSGGGSE
jgi:broad specificity phosphatase PhoE